MKNKRTLLILDNINSASKLGSSEFGNDQSVREKLKELDRFLRRIKRKSPKTFIILTSRSEEVWCDDALPEDRRSVYGKNMCCLGGLDGVSSLDLARDILGGTIVSNATILRTEDYVQLLVSTLQGNPLAIKDILSQFEGQDIYEFFRACTTSTGQTQRCYLPSLSPFRAFSEIGDSRLKEEIYCLTFVNDQCSPAGLRYFLETFTAGADCENFVKRMDAMGFISTDADLFRIHPLLLIHLRRAETAVKLSGRNFIAFFIEQIQKSTFDTLAVAKERADLILLNLFTAYTLAIERKNDSARGTLFQAIATLHSTAKMGPWYMEDFIAQFITKEDWLNASTLPLETSIRCLFMIGNLANMKYVHADVVECKLWGERFFNVGERGTTVQFPGMPVLAFPGPLALDFLDKLKASPAIFKFSKPWLYSLYGLAELVGWHLGDIAKVVLFDSKVKSLDLPIPVTAPANQVLGSFVAKAQQLASIYKTSPVYRSGTSKVDLSATLNKLTANWLPNVQSNPSEAQNTTHSMGRNMDTQRAFELIMTGFTTLFEYYRTDPAQATTRQNLLTKAKDSFHSALERSYSSSQSTFYGHIYLGLASIAHERHEWEEIEKYLAVFEKEMDVLKNRTSVGPLQQTYALQMKIFKADASLGLGRLAEAVDSYSSIPEDLDKLQEDGVRREYIGDPFGFVRSELQKKGSEVLKEAVLAKEGLLEAILKSRRHDEGEKSKGLDM